MLELFQRVWKGLNPPTAQKTEDALRIGILGAARIAPMALILPAKSHAEVVIAGVAARDEKRARAFAKKHGIEKVYFGSKGYQELIDDPSINAIYNPLPNGLHYEWAAKALAAGKHVLLEKPSTCTAAATQKLFDIAKEKNVVLLEAFHYRFHPAFLRFMELIHDGELGKLNSVSSIMSIPTGFVKMDDIRFNFDLGGGSLMDAGCYPVSMVRAVIGSEPTSVMKTSLIPIPADKRIDRSAHAMFSFPDDVTGVIDADLRAPLRWGFLPVLPKFYVIAHLEKGDVKFSNFVAASFFHSITVTPKSGKTRVERVYKPKDGQGEIWWTTYRYQLEAFVNKAKGRTPHAWVTEEDSVDQMKAIEMIYTKGELPLRAQTYFTP